MKITTDRAIEILAPSHRERYSDLPDGIEQVNEACRMGVVALERGIKKSPHPDGDKNILACWRCGSGEYLHNEDGNRNEFCGQCGQRIDWSTDNK